MSEHSIPPEQRFCLNAPQISSDSAFGEVIILNMESGAYYGLEQEGALLWSWIISDRSREEIEMAFSRRHPAFADAIPAAVQAFIQELLEEKILVPHEGVSGPAVAIAEDAPPPGHEFLAPVLNKYTDMQELLMIDPVHDVDDRGWPHLPVRDA